MMMKRFLSALFVFLCTAQATFAIEEELLRHAVDIKNGSNLSIFDCVAVAFQNSPKIKRQKYNLDIAKSNVGIARSQYFPVISAGIGFYHENNTDNIYYNKYYRELPNIGVSVNELIWNFGKTTAFIKMEEFYKLGAEYEFMDSLCATLFDVKAKYYNVLKTQAIVNIAKRRVELYEHFLKIAKKKHGIMTAQLYLTQAKLELISAQEEYRNAVIDLNNSMYVDSEPGYKIYNTPTFNLQPNFVHKISNKDFAPEKFDFPIDKAVDLAYKNSPDLQVLIATKNAMEQSLKYVKRTYFPDLTADVGYGLFHTNQTNNNSFHVGVNLSSSVNLMELKHSIKGADAQINLANNEINLFKKDLYFEVKRALNNVDKAERQVPIAQKNVNETIETLSLIEKEYIGGDIEVIFGTYRDAIVDHINSLSNYVNAIYDYNLALIQLEMAMHYHIFDIHHKSEHAVHYHSDDLIQHLVEALNCEGKEEHHHKKIKKTKNKAEKL